MKPNSRYSDVLEKVKHSTLSSEATYPGRVIDYETRMRFVNWCGVRYWEHGAVDILDRGVRNPIGRRTIGHQLNVDFCTLAEVDYDLYTPEGLKVRKSMVLDAPMLWRDREHDMVVNATNYRPIKYACEASPPVPSRNIRIAFPNKTADEEKWPEIQKWIDWVTALKELEARPEPTWNYCGTNHIEMVKAPQEPKGKLLYEMWNMPKETRQRLRKLFLEQNATVRELPWLKTQKAAA